MDPDAYKSMSKVWSKGTLPPIPGDENMQDAGQPQPPSTDWNVYSPTVMSGNLNSGMSSNLKRDVEWLTPAKEKPTGKEPYVWTTTERQPFMWDGKANENPNEPTPRAPERVASEARASAYPHPSLSLPHPSLSLDFRMSVTLNPRISVGATPFGHRNCEFGLFFFIRVGREKSILLVRPLRLTALTSPKTLNLEVMPLKPSGISFTGGTWSGSWGSGTVLPGGQDSQIIIPDGSARLETNYILQTHDDPPAHIVIKTNGWRTGSAEVLAQLADPEQADKVDPRSYLFRLFIEMETGDERYRDKVNCGMWVGSGMRKGAEVIYDAYRLT
ncbi:UPF0311 protein [Lachnellula suecica]|uniref:UPF0311 protein n=1 Tax=Lachnellula suecica TaxID=602035 RepID=A0A8T9C345_9HELO|nr:UPF0311 protein [Lachnellula suecica]